MADDYPSSVITVSAAGWDTLSLQQFETDLNGMLNADGGDASDYDFVASAIGPVCLITAFDYEEEELPD